MIFISLSNNRKYFSKQEFNRYLNPYTYYLLILLSLKQLNLLFSVDFFLQVVVHLFNTFTNIIP